MTKIDHDAVWVGLLELDVRTPVTPITDDAVEKYHFARVLVRMHGAPLGHVTVPTRPHSSLLERVRLEAERALTSEIQSHGTLDGLDDHPGAGMAWKAQVACPRRYAKLSLSGLSVVVCTRDRTKGLQSCLQALQKVEHKPLEILVVDNAPSSTDTKELVAELSAGDARLRYSCEPLPGLSRARNHGLANASFDLVAFTDDDTMVDPGWPTALVSGFTADAEAVCMTGLVAPSSLDTGPERYFDARYQWGEAFQPRQYDLRGHRHQSRLYPFRAGIFGTGANFAVRRDAVTRLGGFDPLLGAGSPTHGGEDLDMFVRIILAGGRICYVPAALVWHRHRTNIQDLGKQLYSYGHGLGAYVAKRLITRELRLGALGQIMSESGSTAGRLKQASHASQLGVVSKRLAISEVAGVAAGALSYLHVAYEAGRNT